MPTVAEYAVARLAALGISHVFGVPGDYSFPFNDAIEANADLTWVASANELNAAYSADGYARVRGAAILNTTYGVGELSALAGVMGSKAERLPVFHLVGQPSARLQRGRKIVHHTLGDGVFGNFEAASASAACVTANLTPQNAIAEMDRVIATAMRHRQPAYITVAQDLANMDVIGEPADGAELHADLHAAGGPVSDPRHLNEAVDAVLSALESAGTAVALPAFTVARYGLKDAVRQFIEKSGMPYATTPMDKATLSEASPQFAGIYNGLLSTPGTAAIVESADVVLNIGGVAFADFNTFGWTDNIDPKKMITIWPDYVELNGRTYGPVSMSDVIAALTDRTPAFSFEPQAPEPAAALPGEPGDAISSPAMYPRIQAFLRPDDIVFCETGLVVTGISPMPFPDNARYHNQTLWGSIGWATPAAFGASLADPTRRVILITGDGSHQLTANEIGVMGRYGSTLTAIVVNNGLYAVEEFLALEAGHEYNVLAPWNYADIPAAMGCNDWYVARVTTVAEFDTALAEAAARAGSAAYLEVVVGPGDVPPPVPPQLLEQIYQTD